MDEETAQEPNLINVCILNYDVAKQLRINATAELIKTAEGSEGDNLQFVEGILKL